MNDWNNWTLRGALNLVCVLSLVFAGCKQSGPVVVPASGIVTLDGKPLVGARVTFISDLPPSTKEFPPTPQGTSDDTGRFKLSISGADEGAVPGKYKVIVSLIVAKEGVAIQPGMDVRQLMMSGQAEESVPAVYTDPARTPLNVEIPVDGSDALNLELTSS